MQLKVGKTYITADGRTTTIVRENSNLALESIFRFKGEGEVNQEYSGDGRVFYGQDNEDDLVEEAPNMFTLEVGKYYQSRAGKLYKIARRDVSQEDTCFEFVGHQIGLEGESLEWNAQGHFFTSGESPHDLLEQANLVLEVGKTYKSLGGAAYLVTSQDANVQYTYREFTGHQVDDQENIADWSVNGRYLSSHTTPYDLVEECIDPAPVHLEIGKTYLCREGSKFVITERNLDEIGTLYEFSGRQVEDPEELGDWNEFGNYRTQPSSMDLIKLVDGPYFVPGNFYTTRGGTRVQFRFAQESAGVPENSRLVFTKDNGSFLKTDAAGRYTGPAKAHTKDVVGPWVEVPAQIVLTQWLVVARGFAGLFTQTFNSLDAAQETSRVIANVVGIQRVELNFIEGEGL